VTAKKNYSVLLEGVDARDLAVGVLRDLCDLFLEGAQRSTRLVAEGRSGARGPAPAWLTSAADLRISKFAPGSLDLGIQAPRLADVAPEIFAQQQLFPAGTSSDASAFDLFLDAAEDAARGKRDSERLDAGVLDILGRASALFAKGGTRLTIGGEGRARVMIDPEAAQTIRTLADETPASRVTRVRGVLDTLTSRLFSPARPEAVRAPTMPMRVRREFTSASKSHGCVDRLRISGMAITQTAASRSPKSRHRDRSEATCSSGSSSGWCSWWFASG
jgi:hypothetical protein